jgi:hypothetical protein
VSLRAAAFCVAQAAPVIFADDDATTRATAREAVSSFDRGYQACVRAQ